MITASEAMARFTSSCVIAPTPRPMTRRVTLLAAVALEQRVLQGLNRAGHVALDDQQQLFALAGLEGRLEVLERDPATALGELGGPLAGLPALGDLPGHPVVGDDEEVVAPLRHRGEA